MNPSSAPRPTDSHAEHALYEALAKVTNEWTAFHSLKLRTKEGWEGEGDFVIADPNVGLLVLEVKGGAIEQRDGRWLQNGQPMKKSPRDQAQGFVRHLVQELQKAGCETPPFGVACVFPDCDFSAGPTNGDLRGLVLGRRDLPHLGAVLPEVFKRALGPGRAPQNRKWLEALKSLFGRPWVPTVTPGDRVEDAAQRAVQLDEAQFRLLEFAGETPRALVVGGAGTGKTLVATELCRRRAARGESTLYLCFTDALARAVAREFAGRPNLRAMSIRQLAVDLLRSSGATIPQADKAFWEEVSLTAACEALPDERPALLVVDEGQDFEANDWMLVQELASRGLWVFQDHRQAFWTERKLPEALAGTLGGRFELQKAWRCPGALAAFAESYVDASASRAQPPPEVLQRVVCEEREVLEKTRHELERLLREGAKPEQIAIISLSGMNKSELYKLDTLGSTPLVRAVSPDASSAVIADTFLRFKGLERPFVIITELAGKHVTHYETRMHIALTRATVQAIVVAGREAVEADPRLA